MFKQQLWALAGVCGGLGEGHAGIQGGMVQARLRPAVPVAWIRRAGALSSNTRCKLLSKTVN
jgi:hypothetical protein